jgi:hypothetical protein
MWRSFVTSIAYGVNYVMFFAVGQEALWRQRRDRAVFSGTFKHDGTDQRTSTKVGYIQCYRLSDYLFIVLMNSYKFRHILSTCGLQIIKLNWLLYRLNLYVDLIIDALWFVCRLDVYENLIIDALFCRLDTTLGKPLHLFTRDKERVTVFSKLSSMEKQIQDLDQKMDRILVLLQTQRLELVQKWPDSTWLIACAQPVGRGSHRARTAGLGNVEKFCSVGYQGSDVERFMDKGDRQYRESLALILSRDWNDQ